jgi:hypothetical protein
MMRTCWVLGIVVATLGCATSPGGKHGSPSLWPSGSEPQLRFLAGVKFRQQGKISVETRAPLYVVLLELRPGLDSLDVRPATDFGAVIPVTGSSDLYTSMETVDASPQSTVSMEATKCTTVQMGAGDAGREFCPISRSYGPESGPQWRFRNRVFLLMSDQPFLAPLPGSLRWSARGTTPPVAAGAKWTAVEL